VTATLVIRLPAPDRADDAPVAWTLFDEGARAASGEAAPGSAPDLPPGGAGEPTHVTIPAAIGNAVFDATGVRFRRLPLGAERVRSALG
jgi:hypothetical protein